jgi:hypothetical protein
MPKLPDPFVENIPITSNMKIKTLIESYVEEIKDLKERVKILTIICVFISIFLFY